MFGRSGEEVENMNYNKNEFSSDKNILRVQMLTKKVYNGWLTGWNKKKTW